MNQTNDQALFFNLCDSPTHVEVNQLIPEILVVVNYSYDTSLFN